MRQRDAIASSELHYVTNRTSYTRDIIIEDAFDAINKLLELPESRERDEAVRYIETII